MQKSSLLIVDDHEHILKQLTWALRDDFEVHTAATKEQAFEALRRVKPSLLSVDLALTPGGEGRREGFDVLDAALEQDPRIKAVVITSDQDKESAIQAVARGAFDYFVKPLPLEELRAALKRAAYLASLERQARPSMRASAGDTGLLGESTAMLELREMVKRIAETDFTALILGESGTGKEVIASAIWRLSDRRRGPFIVVNCAAVPEALMESELFGHERGSFTGAHALKQGKVELADQGTLFLDEIGELTLALQSKLLRFLEEQTVERIGGMKTLQLDVRVIAATNRGLEKMVRDGTFREDLFYRLNVLPVHVPPLRDRDRDVLLFANFFLDQLATEQRPTRKSLARDAEAAMLRHSWPGNVRELQNVIKAATVRSPAKLISAKHLGLPDTGSRRDLRAARDDLERVLVESALRRNNGIISRAARDLSISRVSLYDLLNKHGLRSLAASQQAEKP